MQTITLMSPPPSLPVSHSLANLQNAVALLWHLTLLGGFGWNALTQRRVTRQVVGVVLCGPLITAAGLHWLSFDFLDAAALTLLAGVLLAVGRALPSSPVSYAQGGARWVGGAAVLLAVLYPPLVYVVDPPSRMLFAPLGVLPAPTLLLVAGAGLLVARLGSPAWAIWSAVFALGYALSGLLGRGPWHDAALVPLAVALLLGAKRNAERTPAGLSAERADIDAFLRLRKIALVGVSHRDDDFSRLVLRTLLERGVDVTPIHPAARVIAGQVAYASVRDIPRHIEGALIMTPPTQTLRVLEDCAEVGVHHVWLHRGMGPGASSHDALALAARLKLRVVADRCIMMFLDPARGSIHRAHAAVERVLGRFPKESEPS